MSLDPTRGNAVMGYAYAAGAVVAATIVATALGLRLDSVAVVPYLVAVGVSAALGGFGPALAATALSAVLCYRWFLGPLLSLDPDGGMLRRLVVYRLAIFVAGCLVLTAASGLRWRVERELRRSQRQLLRFLGDRHVGLCEVDADGRIAWIDDGACALLGRSCPEITGSPLSEVLADPGLAAAIAACRTEDHVIENRFARVRCGDGAYRDVLVNANGSWTMNDGRYDHMVFAIVPVTRAAPRLPMMGRRVA